ncbi:MAG TPA: glycosyltransferase family 39 protein, partial [Dehalococcoidia bacterium]|nr:glycosyltransferase family 39 protein [Dehalococcoidia bacterium]
AARLLMAVIGLAAVPLVYLLGVELFSTRVGLLSAAILAIAPYHVVITRQVLLDGPETTFFLLTMYLIARYGATSAPRYLYVGAAAAALTFLAKETGVLVLLVIAAFALVTPAMRVGWKRLGIAALVFVVAISPYPISILISNASDTAKQFLIWQLLRRPNHTFTFYGEVLFSVLGPVLLVLGVVGVVLAFRRSAWEDRLLLTWIFVPFAFYEAWPVKGYQYLLPTLPAIIALAARVIDLLAIEAEKLRSHAEVVLRGRATLLRGAVTVLSAALLLSLAAPTLAIVNNGAAVGSLAGTGGLPGGREAGAWIDQNLPQGAGFVTIGPTLSNIIEFYGHRRSQGLSVSPNPLHRNPAYDPIPNPDAAIRSLKVQYLAWDIWSASRSEHFAARLMEYVDKYHGRLVFEEQALVRNQDGSVERQVVIRVYEVRP